MRVALDVAHLRQGRAGVARATDGLAAALAGLDGVEVVPVGGGPRPRRGTAAQKLLVLRQDGLWYPLETRRAARRVGADVLHCPAPRGPLWRGHPPLVLGVHDLTPLRNPETMAGWNRRYSRALLPAMLAAADLVVAPSADTARDLERLLGVAPARARVVPHGVDRRFFAPAAAAAPVQGPYVLFVGTPEPRKNLARLAAALRLLRREGRRERLVVAGADGWGAGAPADPDVRFLGRVADDALPALYAGASCLAIPSLHEGFGLPALEAMAAGCPVVAADAGALPEVCGGAAVLVDPLDVAAIARGLARAVDGRDALVRAGRRRAQAFTWEAAAAAMLDVYREAAATASPGR